MKKTKIVCTIGPASSQEDVLRKIIMAGMDVARLNFSHGTHESHAAVIRLLRKLSAETGRPIGILGDICGPKIRTGKLRQKPVVLLKNQRFTITTDEILGDAERVSTIYKNFCKDIKPGERVLLDDGKLELQVEKITDNEAVCIVITEGELGENKGINLPGSNISAPAVTAKDKEDIKFALEQGLDFIAVSFVRAPEDVIDVKKMVHKSGQHTQVIAKIERPEAVARIEEIVNVSDGIMVARGDLGIEMDIACVPLIQKRIIEQCRKLEKPVITATQMLESMMSNPTPSRAETTDIANAILDGTDAVMLSGETASGKYPVTAVQTMAHIAEETEKYMIETGHFQRRGGLEHAASITDAISDGSAVIAKDLGVKVIIVATQSGGTARLVSKNRPPAPVLALTNNPAIIGRMCLYWGVSPVSIPKLESLESIFSQGAKIAVNQQLALSRDRALFVCGFPFGKAGTTNTIQILQIEDITAPVASKTNMMLKFEVGENTFLVDLDKCTGCGVCQEICSSGIYETRSGKVSLVKANSSQCIGDHRCAQLCPTEAIKIKRKNE